MIQAAAARGQACGGGRHEPRWNDLCGLRFGVPTGEVVVRAYTYDGDA